MTYQPGPAPGAAFPQRLQPHPPGAPQEGRTPTRRPPTPLNLWRSGGGPSAGLGRGMYLYEEEFLSQVDRGTAAACWAWCAGCGWRTLPTGGAPPRGDPSPRPKRTGSSCFPPPGATSAPSTPSTATRGPHPPAPLKPENTCPPRYEFSDGLVTHRLWVVNDPVAIQALREDFAGPQAVHRRRPPPL